MLFERVPPVQIFFSGYDSYTYIHAQLRARSLKVSGHADHICKSEGLKVTIIDDTNIFAVQDFLKTLSNQILLLMPKKGIYSVSLWQISALLATYCSSYVL